jgi:hypothetical protein
MNAWAHRCCHKSQPVSAACHTESLQNFVKAETAAPVAPLVAVALPVELPAAALAVQFFSFPAVESPDYSGGSPLPLVLRV